MAKINLLYRDPETGNIVVSTIPEALSGALGPEAVGQPYLILDNSGATVAFTLPELTANPDPDGPPYVAVTREPLLSLTPSVGGNPGYAQINGSLIVAGELYTTTGMLVKSDDDGLYVEVPAGEGELERVDLVTRAMLLAATGGGFSGGGASGPQLPVGLQFPLVEANNENASFTQNTEYCFGFTLPGSGFLDALAMEVINPGDAGSVLRIGVRANDGGKPGEVLYEGTVDATSAGGKQITGLAIPYGEEGSEVFWFSMVWQGGTSSPSNQAGHDSPWFWPATAAAGYGAAGMGNVGWHHPCISRSGVSGLLADSAPPADVGSWGGSGGAMPHFFVRRGSV